jgi:hypothetical protein
MTVNLDYAVNMRLELFSCVFNIHITKYPETIATSTPRYTLVLVPSVIPKHDFQILDAFGI